MTPARLLVLLYSLALALGTVLLLLPYATRGPAAPFDIAFFTATSAISVTGLVVVDTHSYWSGFGHLVILALIQLGGLGIVTLGSIAGLVVSRRLGLSGRRLAQLESGLDLGDVRHVLRTVLKIAAVVEATTFVLLTGVFYFLHHAAFPEALRLGGFHAISAFNNSGFSLFSNSLEDYVTDPFICGIVACAVLIGAVGFPVLTDIRRHHLSPRRWSLHTKLTLSAMGAVLAVSALTFLWFEWTNPATLGELQTSGKILASFFNTSMRTAGFSSIDFGQLNETTQLATIVSMFIGGGSVSAAGGIKVTTLALILLAVITEYRGDQDVTAFRRRIPPEAIRQAVAITLTGVVAVLTVTMLILAIEKFPLTNTLFEVTSAASIVGLSTGLSGELNTASRLIITVLMLLGRLGPMTVGAALMLRERQRLYRFAQERPIVG